MSNKKRVVTQLIQPFLPTILDPPTPPQCLIETLSAPDAQWSHHNPLYFIKTIKRAGADAPPLTESLTVEKRLHYDVLPEPNH